jgi:hypothetical protein
MAIPTAIHNLACDRRPARECCSPAHRRLPVSFTFVLIARKHGGGLEHRVGEAFTRDFWRRTQSHVRAAMSFNAAT